MMYSCFSAKLQTVTKHTVRERDIASMQAHTPLQRSGIVTPDTP